MKKNSENEDIQKLSDLEKGLYNMQFICAGCCFQKSELCRR